MRRRTMSKQDLPYLCFTAVEDSTLKLGSVNVDERTSDFINTIDLNISIIESNNRLFEKWDGSLVNIPAGKSIYIYGDNNEDWTTSGYYHPYFIMTGKIKASGNVMSLLSKECSNDFPFEYTFLRLFYKCASLLTAPELPATTLVCDCYDAMFLGCSSLEIAPKLPALNLANNCYQNMFDGCSSLITPPDLPATNLYKNCYCAMFENCTSLETAPLLPAITLKYYCYSCMFRNCPKVDKIVAYFKDYSLDYQESWECAIYGMLYGAAATGSFYKNDENTKYIKRGEYYIPNGWNLYDTYV